MHVTEDRVDVFW